MSMSEEKIIELAKMAGFPFNKYGLLKSDDEGEIDANEMLKKFADLVLEDSLDTYLRKYGFVSISRMRKEISNEREACANICDGTNRDGKWFASAIRSRGDE